MARHPTRHKELLPLRQIRDSFRRGRGIGPGPCWEFVHKIVACKDELLGGDLACGAEGRSVRDRRQTIPPCAEGGVEDVHVGPWAKKRDLCLLLFG